MKVKIKGASVEISLPEGPETYKVSDAPECELNVLIRRLESRRQEILTKQRRQREDELSRIFLQWAENDKMWEKNARKYYAANKERFDLISCDDWLHYLRKNQP